MLDQLQIHRQILYDLSVHTLEPMRGMHERLAYVASLRDPQSGTYCHERLSAVFGGENVNQALAGCHEELFERLLESPLALQEEDLLSYLDALPGGREENLQAYCSKANFWIPSRAPDYLKRLFCSNLEVLCELLRGRQPTVRSGM